MSEWKVPSWLENYNTPTGAQAGQDFSNTFLKPVADTVTGISNQYNKDKIDEILDRASKESAWTKKEIDYTDIGNKLLPYDRDLAEKYLTKGKEQQAAQSKIDTNKAVAKAFNKPKEDYAASIAVWNSGSRLQNWYDNNIMAKSISNLHAK